jgi:hypothetical protein
VSAFVDLRWLLAAAMAAGFVFGWHWSLMPVRRPLQFRIYNPGFRGLLGKGFRVARNSSAHMCATCVLFYCAASFHCQV